VYCRDIRIAVGEICKLSVSVYFVLEDHVTQPLTVVVGQVVTERNMSLFNSKVDNGHNDALLPIEERKLWVFLLSLFL
jgi:hypothetical protein